MSEANPHAGSNWNALCDLYEQVLRRSGDRRFVSYKLAMNVRKVFADECGCGEDKIFYYKWTFAPMPENDVSERVDGAFEAISETETGWAIGIGISLEVDTNTYPKTIFVWPIEVSEDGNELTITSRMFDGSVSIPLNDPTAYLPALQDIARRMYVGLTDALEFWIRGGQRPKRIGFG